MATWGEFGLLTSASRSCSSQNCNPTKMKDSVHLSGKSTTEALALLRCITSRLWSRPTRCRMYVCPTLFSRVELTMGRKSFLRSNSLKSIDPGWNGARKRTISPAKRAKCPEHGYIVLRGYKVLRGLQSIGTGLDFQTPFHFREWRHH